MFEHSLVGVDTRGSDVRKLAFLPLALALHAALVGGLTVAQSWDVAEVPEPRLIEPYVVPARFVELVAQVPTEKPPRVPERAPEQRAATIQPASPPAGPVQPPPEMPALAPPDPDAPQFDGVVPGPPGDGAPVDGPLGPGGPHGPIVADGPAGDGGGVERFRVGMTRPEAISQPSPIYPPMARRAMREGTVVLDAVIDEQGRVIDVRVLRGIGLGCDEAAVKAVEQWRFQPATVQGRPIKVLYTLTVHFRLAR